MSGATAAIALEICVNIQEAIRLEIRYVTLDLAFRGHVSDDLVHPLDRVTVSMRILCLAQEMVVDLLVDIFGILTSPDKVVAIHELEDVDMRHFGYSYYPYKLYVFVFIMTETSPHKKFTPTGNRTRVKALEAPHSTVEL